MALLDFSQFVVRRLAMHGHGQLGFLVLQGVRTGADQGPCREHVVQGGHTIATTRQHKQREVFGMSVNGRQKPEQQLGAQEVAPVFLKSLPAFEHRQTSLNARPARLFVFLVAGDTFGLAKIFLGQTGNPALWVPASVKALDHQYPPRAKVLNLTLCRGQTKLAHNLIAKPFVLDRQPQVEVAPGGDTYGRLENVRGGRGTQGPTPLAAHLKQRCFFLSPGNRQAKGFFIVLRPRADLGTQRTQMLLNLLRCECLIP